MAAGIWRLAKVSLVLSFYSRCLGEGAFLRTPDSVELLELSQIGADRVFKEVDAVKRVKASSVSRA